ncbi:TPA: hypothetical protein KC606_RS26390, partial [Escherichia coli O146]
QLFNKMIYITFLLSSVSAEDNGGSLDQFRCLCISILLNILPTRLHHDACLCLHISLWYQGDLIAVHPLPPDKQVLSEIYLV